MRLYVSNRPLRDLDCTGTLHLRPDCWTLRRGDRRPFEATVSEVVSADHLCDCCVVWAARQLGPATLAAVDATLASEVAS